MEPETPEVAQPEANASAEPQTSLSETEQKLLADLPSFLVPDADQFTYEAMTAQEAPAAVEAPAEVAAPAAPVVEATPVVVAPQAQEVDPAAQAFTNMLDRQNAVLAAFEARLNPPKPAPREKTLEEMDEVEAFQHLTTNKAVEAVLAKLAPDLNELRAFKEARAAAQREAATTALATEIYNTAAAQALALVPAERHSVLTAQDRDDLANEVLATQAAKDGRSAAEAVAIIKARRDRVNALTAPASAAIPGAKMAPRPVAQARPATPAPGSSAGSAPGAGVLDNMPPKAEIQKAYGRDAGSIMAAIQDGFSRIRAKG